MARFMDVHNGFVGVTAERQDRGCTRRPGTPPRRSASCRSRST